MFCLKVYMHTRCMPGACRGQRRVLDPLELQLQTAVRPHVSVGNWAWAFCKSSKSSSYLAPVCFLVTKVKSDLTNTSQFFFSFFPLARVWQYLGAFFVKKQERKRCYWHLLGRGQKCDSNFAVNGTVPFNKELPGDGEMAHVKYLLHTHEFSSLT